MRLLACLLAWGQKHILYDFLDSCPLVEKTWSWLGSEVKKHCFLPGSKVKKRFFTKTSKSRFHAEGRSNGGRPCPSGLKKAFLLKVCLFVCDKLKRTSYDRKMFMEFVQYT